MIVTGDEAGDVHPFEPVTVKVNVPAEMPVKTAVVPLPFMVVPAGTSVSIHEPEEGRPLSATLPVATVHVGCVMAPVTGAVGEDGWAGITTSADRDEEVHPAALVTE